MKKSLVLLLSLFLCGVAFCGCTLNIEDTGKEGDSREISEIYEYDASAGQLLVNDLVFTQPVTVTGDEGFIMFSNCLFEQGIINAADSVTAVMLLDDCQVIGDCIFTNTVQDSGADAMYPMFISGISLNVICENGCCAYSYSGSELSFNGRNYTEADITVFEGEGDPVAYAGQEHDTMAVSQYWQDGAPVITVSCSRQTE